MINFCYDPFVSLFNSPSKTSTIFPKCFFITPPLLMLLIINIYLKFETVYAFHSVIFIPGSTPSQHIRYQTRFRKWQASHFFKFIWKITGITHNQYCTFWNIREMKNCKLFTDTFESIVHRDILEIQQVQRSAQLTDNNCSFRGKFL